MGEISRTFQIHATVNVRARFSYIDANIGIRRGQARTYGLTCETPPSLTLATFMVQFTYNVAVITPIYVVAANSVICRSLAVWVGPYTANPSPITEKKIRQSRVRNSTVTCHSTFNDSRCLDSTTFHIRVEFIFYSVHIQDRQESDLRRIGEQFFRE